jgi:hypothetical protein
LNHAAIMNAPLAHNAKPRNVATKLLTRILRQKRSFGGVQFAELFFGLA